MKIIKNIFNGIIDFLMLVVIVFALGVTLVSLTNKEGVSKIGKYIPLNVQTESMKDTILKGDFIIMEECDPNTLKEGDVIAFFATEQDQVIVKTHRIVEVDDKSGSKSFITRGDNNMVDDYVPVFPTDIIGKWEGVRIAKVGNILDFVSSQYGFLLCIILPLFALFIYQIYKFIIVIIEEKTASVKGKNTDTKEKLDIEEDKELKKKTEEAKTETKEEEINNKDKKDSKDKEESNKEN